MGLVCLGYPSSERASLLRRNGSLLDSLAAGVLEAGVEMLGAGAAGLAQWALLFDCWVNMFHSPEPGVSPFSWITGPFLEAVRCCQGWSVVPSVGIWGCGDAGEFGVGPACCRASKCMSAALVWHVFVV